MRARSTDPLTSHEAAATVKNVSATQQVILKILVKPMTDDDLVSVYNQLVLKGKAPMASPSGIRSRRHELAVLNLVRVVDSAKSWSGRRSYVWSSNV